MVTSVTSPATASRGLKASPLQRISEIVLITGTVAAAATAAGPLWLVRLGVATAIMTALVACAFAWRELNTRSTRARRCDAQGLSRAWCRAAGGAVSERRGRRRLGPAYSGCRQSDRDGSARRIAEQRVEIAGLRDDRVYLRGEVEHRDKVIFDLREAVREREPELDTLR